MFLDKSMKRHSKLRLVILIVTTITLALLASVLVYASQVKQVEINNKGQKIIVKTMGNTVKDVLDENHIKFDAEDIVSPGLDIVLGTKGTISIEKKQVQTVEIQNPVINQNITQKTDAANVAKVEQQTVQNTQEKKPETTKKVVVVNSKIPFETERKSTDRLQKGVTQVVRQGKDGLVEKSYQVTYKDGKEVERKYIGQKIVTKPINRLIEVGTKAVNTNKTTSRGDSIRYKRVIEMRATAYSSCYEDTGKRPGDPDYGRTASGLKAKPGIVAVDPKVIPLGTRLYVESTQKGVPDYGLSLAADTGGAIKGNKIDLYFETAKEVDNWGVRKVKVYILE